MTRQQFQIQYQETFKTFLETPCGQAALTTLSAMRPPYEFPKEEHLLAENRGGIRGYELAIRNILGLAMPAVAVKEPEINYGVVGNNQPSEK